ncbi:MAG: cold shock domain-containing protein, partial [Candidatus Riflebacteria bacterium]|nr:cold shock domain-containing protein [Candidatus Riflebacteria bacterium]
RLLGLAVQTLRDSLKMRPNQEDVVQLIAQIQNVRKEIGKTVEEITYDPAPDAYVEGFVKWYNPETGMGVLTCDDYPEVLLHYTAIKDENCVVLNKGDAVKFGVVRDNLSPIAVQVEKLSEPSLSDAMPGVIEKFDADKKMGIIRSCDGKEVFFSFSALTQEAAEELRLGLGVLYESKSVTGLDDSVSQQAVRIRVRKKRVLPVEE